MKKRQAKYQAMQDKGGCEDQLDSISGDEGGHEPAKESIETSPNSAVNVPVPDKEDDLSSLVEDGRKAMVAELFKSKREIKELKSHNEEREHKYRQEVQAVRNFYTNIAYGRTRSGRIVRNALNKKFT